MNNNNYLREYKKTSEKDLYRGIGGKFRKALDNKAERMGQPNRHALFLKRILDIIGIGPEEKINILDVGCGNGWAISYQSPNIRYYAIDKGNVYQEKLASQGIKFSDLNVTQDILPFHNDFFDIILLNHIIEHLYDYDFFISELYRVVKKDRFVYIRTPDIKKVKFSFFDDYTHVKPYSESSLNHMMQAYGFKILKLFHSNHGLINVDLLTEGLIRDLLFNKVTGGAEIEAIYLKIL